MPSGVAAADSQENIIGAEAAMNADAFVAGEDTPGIGRAWQRRRTVVGRIAVEPVDKGRIRVEGWLTLPPRLRSASERHA